MRSRLYQPFVYYISKAVVQLPFQLMNVVVFVLIVYHMTGLRSDAGSLFKHLIILTFAFLIFSQVLPPLCAIRFLSVTRIVCSDPEPRSSCGTFRRSHIYHWCLLCGIQSYVLRLLYPKRPNAVQLVGSSINSVAHEVHF